HLPRGQLSAELQATIFFNSPEVPGDGPHEHPHLRLQPKVSGARPQGQLVLLVEHVVLGQPCPDSGTVRSCRGSAIVVDSQLEEQQFRIYAPNLVVLEIDQCRGVMAAASGVEEGDHVLTNRPLYAPIHEASRALSRYSDELRHVTTVHGASAAPHFQPLLV